MEENVCRYTIQWCGVYKLDLGSLTGDLRT